LLNMPGNLDFSLIQYYFVNENNGHGLTQGCELDQILFEFKFEFEFNLF